MSAFELAELNWRSRSSAAESPMAGLHFRILLAALAATLLLTGRHAAAQTTELPVELNSIQHFYSILKRCEMVAPDRTAIRAREASFDRLLDGAKPADGVWRTYLDADGRPQETRFHSAREMVYSLEFASDIKRYQQVVSAVPLNIQVQDCLQFDSLVEQALAGK
jgi:hypothetical protein